MMDARKGEVYAANYQNEDLTIVSRNYTVDTVENLLTRNESVVITGDALYSYEDRIRACLSNDAIITDEEFWRPRAHSVTRLAQSGIYPELSGSQLFSLAPLYLRRSEAEVQWDRKHNIK